MQFVRQLDLKQTIVLIAFKYSCTLTQSVIILFHVERIWGKLIVNSDLYDIYSQRRSTENDSN